MIVFKRGLIYKRIKITVYLLGFCLTITSMLKYGLEGTHIPPLCFLLALLMLLLSTIWIIIDFCISYFIKEINAEYLIHYTSLISHLLIIVFILYK